MTGYFIEKCSEVLYNLLIGEGNAKERLLQNQTKITLCLSINLPEEVTPKKEKIESVLFAEPADIMGNQILHTSYMNSVCKMRKAKAANVIKDLNELYWAVKYYEEDKEITKKLKQ